MLLIQFQLRAGLMVSGTLDDATANRLNAPDAPGADAQLGAYASISADEVELLAPYMVRAVRAEDDETRRGEIRQALALSCGRFWELIRAVQEQMPALRAQAETIREPTQNELTQWLGGATFTDRLDEPRRRAVAGYRLLASFPDAVGAYRLVAHPQLALPRNDPQRNNALIAHLQKRALAEAASVTTWHCCSRT